MKLFDLQHFPLLLAVALFVTSSYALPTDFSANEERAFVGTDVEAEFDFTAMRATADANAAAANPTAANTEQHTASSSKGELEKFLSHVNGTSVGSSSFFFFNKHAWKAFKKKAFVCLKCAACDWQYDPDDRCKHRCHECKHG